MCGWKPLFHNRNQPATVAWPPSRRKELRTEKSGLSCWVHPPNFPAMGHSFVPQDPFQRVLRLSEDLLKSGLSFSIALKIEGSVDFSFSSGQKAVRLGAENTTTRGPSYTRRQIKRIMQRMEPQMPPGASSETVGAEGRGGPDFSDNSSYPARDLRSGKIKKSQAEKKLLTPVSRMAPATSSAETQTNEYGWKQRSDDKRVRWISSKVASTSGEIKSLQERVDFHEKLHRANLRLTDYCFNQLTTSERTWHGTWDGTMDGLKDKEELMTKIFGFPDEETLLQLLQKEFPQPVVEISEMCPNCESPSMSSTHICDNEND